jgi:hypothetical protein
MAVMEQETAVERIEKELQLCESELKTLMTRYVTSSRSLQVVFDDIKIGKNEEAGPVHLNFARAAAAFFAARRQQPPADIHSTILWAMYTHKPTNSKVSEYVLHELFMQKPGEARDKVVLGQP